MPSITRGLLRWGIIGGLALGGLTILVGPGRVAAAFDQIRSHARHAADEFVDDPIALRRQLQTLAEQYPVRIGQVRGEIAEIDRQARQLEHDSEVAKRVVAMATDDLNRIRVAVSEVQASTHRLVGLREEAPTATVDSAKDEARRINNVRLSYQDRYASSKQQLTFLGQQKDRMSKVLSRLETESSEFESKMAVLDRQIDSIERNERLIDMTKDQQAMLAGYDKFGEVGNLGQLEGKLAELRTVQEAQLEALSKAGVPSDYEQRAKSDLADDEWNKLDPFAIESTPTTKLPVPSANKANSAPEKSTSVTGAQARGI
ncbi:MAG: hypothetical protein SGJ09_04760 [Phycisphaerae bacterium]|nr:hypothetical protein [Phycisphaerae bacterium]